MRILQVITLSELGGAQSVLVNLANSLTSEHEVAVVAGEGDGKMWKILHRSIRQYPCRNLIRALSPVKDVKAVLELRSVYRDFKPDIIHLHSSKAGMLGRLAFPSRKVIYTVHGFDSIRIAHRQFLPIERIMQYACGAIVGVSHYDEQNLKKEGINKNVSCVYNGISKALKPSDLSLHIPKHFKKVVLCIARLSYPKRYDLFLQIAALLPDYAFVWIGNQQNVDNELANVFFLGNIPNASCYCHLADLFILPSDYEGLPMVVIEAMSCAKPVVASNVGGLSEIVQDNVTGFVVNNSAEAFAEKISNLLEDHALYQQCCFNAFQRYQKDLTVGQMKAAYLTIYNKLLLD